MKTWLALAVVLGGLAATPAATQSVAWDQWQHVPGVVDLGGPRSDGSLVVAAAGRLYLLTREDGTLSPFAAGADGFSTSPDIEPYFVITPSASVPDAGCAFGADDVYIFDLTTGPNLVRVDSAGHVSSFASFPGVATLGGIALDTVGRFGSRLLVTGSNTSSSGTSVFAVDCRGTVTTLTGSAPTLEGGLAVAPMTFGQFGGELIAPDENSGQIWAVGPDGQASLVAQPNLPTGGDTGVESLGFAIAGPSTAYLADRGTPNNPFPGSDSLLRLRTDVLSAAGVHEGDLLVATEGGGTTVGVRCAETCSVFPVAAGPSGGHIEGHVLLAPD